MRNSRIVGLGIVAALVVIGLISAYWGRRDPVSSNRPSVAASVPPVYSGQSGATPAKIPVAADLDGQPALMPPNREELSVKEAPPLLALLGAKNTRPELEAGLLLDVLNTYRRLIGTYPAGEDNRQFVNALLGANREKMPFVSPDHPRINRNGEIVDAWGTPFFFHLYSRVAIEVRSAGPDRRFFTADDIIAGKMPELHGQFEPDASSAPNP